MFCFSFTNYSVLDVSKIFACLAYNNVAFLNADYIFQILFPGLPPECDRGPHEEPRMYSPSVTHQSLLQTGHARVSSVLQERPFRSLQTWDRIAVTDRCKPHLFCA